MTVNAGKIDRMLRLILGVVLVAAPFIGNLAVYGSSVAVIVSVVVGLVMLVTALTGFCPLYRVFGMRTTGR